MTAAHIPDLGRHPKNCFAVIEIAHPGGEALAPGISCGGQFGTTSPDGATTIIGGSTDARRIDLKFANGRIVHARVKRGVFIATFPVALGDRAFSLVQTKADGTVISRPWPVFPGGDFSSAVR